MKRLAFALLLAATARADTLLVVNKGDSVLAFVDPATLQVVAKVPVGNTPHEVAASTDGRIALVTNYGSPSQPGRSISIIDIAGRKERTRMTLPLIRPHGTWAAGNHIYFTAEGSRVVARYDVPGGAIDWTGGTGADGSHMVVVAPGEKKLYTANIRSGTVSVIDLANGPRAIGPKQIAAGKGPEGIDLSPDGRELWVAHSVDGGVSIIDTATDTVRQTFAAGTKRSNRVKFTRDGTRVLISDMGSNQVLVYDAVRRQLLKKINTDPSPEGILMAPDGKRAFVACTSSGKIDIIDLTSLTVVRSFATGRDPDGMAWAH